MEQIKIKDIQEFHQTFRYHRSHNGYGAFFRGQADIDWKLVPKAARKGFNLGGDDLGRFTDWGDKAVAYSELPELPIERLALAQHHGLATRLLDWTQNPLVAAYFAVISEEGRDGAIYILETPETFCQPNITLKQLREADGVFAYIPRAISERMLNQKGMFTVHCPPGREVVAGESRFEGEEADLKKVIIPAGLKPEIQKMLDDYGINHSILFPGLDGLSEYINWQTADILKLRDNSRLYDLLNNAPEPLE